MASTFPATPDALSTTTTGYTAGSGVLAVAAAPTGTPTTSAPWVLGLFLADGTPRGVYRATGRTGATFTGLTLLSGTDADVPSGGLVQGTLTRAELSLYATAVNAIEAALAALGVGLPDDDLSRFGVVTNTDPAYDSTTSPRANATGIQACLDAHGSATFAGTGDIPIDCPIFLGTSGCRITGRVDGSWKVVAATGYAGIMFLAGVPLIPSSAAVILSSQYVALDSTMLPGIGSTPRHGLRLKNGTYLAGLGTGFDADDEVQYWRGRTQLTLDIAYDQPAGSPFAQGNSDRALLCGFGQRYEYGPFHVAITGEATPRAYFIFTTTDGVIRAFHVTLPATGTVRLAIQVDLATPAVVAVVGDAYVAPDLAEIGANWNAGAGLKFRQNRAHHFGVNCAGGDAIAGSRLSGAAWDWTLCGLKLTRGLVYAAGTAGQPAVRLDAQANTALRRYFTVTTGTAALLPLTAAYHGNDRVVPCDNGFQGTHGTLLWLDPDHNNPANTCGGIRLADATVRGNFALGQALSCGNVVGMLVEGGELNAGYGLATTALCVFYSFTVRGTFLSGTGAAVHLNHAYDAVFDRVSLEVKSNYAVIVQNDGFPTFVEPLVIAPGGDPDAIVYCENSGGAYLGLKSDYEAATTHLRSIVDCYADGAGTEYTPNLQVRNLVAGVLPADGAVVRLRGTAKGACVVEGVTTAHDVFAAVVVIEGTTLWRGRVDLTSGDVPAATPATTGDASRFAATDPR